ncbi:MAG: hypothetical protein NC914_00385, partial [Candidatus Omnitrophica bacterium]|nr:hypothetical protein [Candidatus Omnitrophota bacterium]
MQKSFFKAILFVCFIIFLAATPSFSASENLVSYLCENGLKYYKRGLYEEALHEFKVALLLDPGNKTANNYIERIQLQKDLAQKSAFQKVSVQKEPSSRKASPPQSKKEEPVSYRKKEPASKSKKEKSLFLDASAKKQEETSYSSDKDFIDWVVESVNEKIEPVKISGEIRMGIGIASGGNFLWKDADGNLNERDWHILYGPQRENTYDKRIFDRLRLNIDKTAKDGLRFHANLTIDPWSFTAKSDKILATSLWGDTAEVQLKYWSNTRSTISEIYRSFLFADSFILPAIKVKDDKIPATSVGTTWGNTFFIPETKLYRQFQPLREFWVDYKKENLNFRFFPIAYQDQALTTDDPLGFSNHHIYWEESPWLDKWVPGHINTGAVPVGFYRGTWDDSLSFMSRDSDNLRLTALRGFSFQMKPLDNTSVYITSASPKDLWQDYDEFDSNKTAARIKHYLTEDIAVAGTFTSRIGFNDNDIDAVNNLVASDIAVLILDI